MSTALSTLNLLNKPVFHLLQLIRRLNDRGDQGFDVNYKYIITAIVDHVTSFNVYHDCSVDHLAVRLQSYEEVLDICEFSYEIALGSCRLNECGCATLALAAVRLTLKNSLSSFIQICSRLLTNIKSSSKFMAKLCSFMNKHNQTYLLFFVSDTEFSQENKVMSYHWLAAKREVLESILLEKLQGKWMFCFICV